MIVEVTSKDLPYKKFSWDEAERCFGSIRIEITDQSRTPYRGYIELTFCPDEVVQTPNGNRWKLRREWYRDPSVIWDRFMDGNLDNLRIDFYLPSMFSVSDHAYHSATSENPITLWFNKVV